ncbi:protein kinase domain-containing protein [Microbulbifer sp. S227A]|uniref:protein kinase domain-containing protein n=1 Tax=Microbulbifer sp. S227A TaxID=3415131 RepID=UPI003C7D7FB2
MPRDSTITTGIDVSIGQHADRGRKTRNDDFHGALVPDGQARLLKGVALALADGISTSATSRVAAETAVKSLLTDYYATPDSWTVRTAASRVISATNAWLHGQNGALSDINTGQVCTLSALILKGRVGHVLHVGDSRVWRFAGGEPEKLTRDHRRRLSTGEDYLSRALGLGAEIEIDYRAIPLAQGDVFVLTTDGVHDFLTPDDMARILCGADDLDMAAMALVTQAMAQGSDDNLSVLITRVDALPESDADARWQDAGLPVSALPQAGDEVDGFRIVRPLQASARSHVFLAVDPQGRRAALKFPARETAESGASLRRFALEDWIAARVSSPHVVRAAANPQPRSALYVATEFVEGKSLRQWMHDTPRADPDAVRPIIEQIASGLRALHRRQMLHQDLRPENIMIDPDGTVKIIDLGAVSVAGIHEAAPGLLGALPGTFQYTAPEYLSGDVVSWRSDQFALGVIAYEMLTGRLPYGAAVARISNRNEQNRLRYAPACDDDTGLPRWIDTALRRATHPDPLRRYDALSEFVADLSRPGAAWAKERHLPLAERHPVRFWQGVSAILAVICFLLAARLGG